MESLTARDDEKLLSIGDVIDRIRFEYPEITHSSLRFLEREGMIAPLRSVGNHRYFRASDIDRIRQIKRWQRDHHSLQDIRARLASLDRLPAPDVLSASFLRQMLGGNGDQARRDVLDAIDIGLPPETALEGIIAPAMKQIGECWHDGSLSPAQEKIASEIARDVIAEITRQAIPPGPDGPSVVACCVEHEFHELGLRSIVAALKLRGVRVYYLGASVSPRFLLDAIELYRPLIVLLSAKLDESMDAARTAIRMITQHSWGYDQPVILIGGDGASRHRQEIENLSARVVPGASLVQAVNAIQQALSEAAGRIEDKSRGSA